MRCRRCRGWSAPIPTTRLRTINWATPSSQRSDLDQAGKEWQEAVRLKPGMVDAQRALAGYALQKSDMAGMERAATQMISLQPGLPDGYALRSVSFTARRSLPRPNRMRARPQRSRLSPRPATCRWETCARIQQNFPEAETWYKQSLSRDPKSGRPCGDWSMSIC